MNIYNIRVKYKINKGFIVQKMDDKTVIFDGEESVLFTFNETASFIFYRLKLGRSIEEIVKAMVKKYKIGEAEAEKDTKELIRGLLEKKIIKQEEV